LRCNMIQNETDEIVNRHKGLGATRSPLRLCAAPNARDGVKSLYLSNGKILICGNRIAGICDAQGNKSRRR
jgi:hypothetical protein